MFGFVGGSAGSPRLAEEGTRVAQRVPLGLGGRNRVGNTRWLGFSWLSRGDLAALGSRWGRGALRVISHLNPSVSLCWAGHQLQQNFSGRTCAALSRESCDRARALTVTLIQCFRRRIPLNTVPHQRTVPTARALTETSVLCL